MDNIENIRNFANVQWNEGLAKSSSFYFNKVYMIDKNVVKTLVDEWLQDKEYFLVGIEISQDNKIVVEIDHVDGVWIEDCVELSRYIEGHLNRDEEDFELEVGSAGLGQPFKVPQQYINFIGKEVEVLDADGKKVKGILKAVDGNDFTVGVEEKVKVEGKKRPVKQEVDYAFQMDKVKYTKYVISFKETMAKKEQELTASMIDTFREFKETKNIDRTTLVSVLEESFRNVLAKIFGSDENFDVIVNPDKGDFEIYRNRVVVADGEVEDENKEIALTEARKIQADYEVGEDVSENVDFNKFGRRAILTLRQTLASKILELEHDSLYNKYKDRVGQIISGEVYQIWKREILIVDDENNELILPKAEQIPADQYRKGETVRAVILRVDNENNNPKIILSRTAPNFLQRLLEAEVPEIAEGLIAIRRIARMPGERAKIAVETFDERIDPVGACVGVKGSRVHGIVRELCNENLDVINYSSNVKLFIQRALAPARISSVNIDDENKKAEVFLQPEEVSKAIGRSGMNIKLASMLTEYTIDVFREIDESQADEDIYLDEFSDEIDQWVIDAIKGIGLDTAKQVLNAPRDMLVEKADLEEETVDNVLKVLRAEFEQ